MADKLVLLAVCCGAMACYEGGTFTGASTLDATSEAAVDGSATMATHVGPSGTGTADTGVQTSGGELTPDETSDVTGDETGSKSGSTSVSTTGTDSATIGSQDTSAAESESTGADSTDTATDDSVDPNCPELEWSGDLTVNGERNDLGELPGKITVLHGNLVLELGHEDIEDKLGCLANISGHLDVRNLNAPGQQLALEGLGRLKLVGGHVQIDDSNAIENLDWLQSLEQVGDALFVRRLSRLKDVSGLEALESVGTWLTLTELGMLVECRGLGDNLTKVGRGISLVELAQLKSMCAFTGITSLPEHLKVAYAGALIDLRGLESIAQVGEFWLESNPRLENLQALSALKHVRGDSGTPSVNITNNARLMSLDGLDNLETVADALSVSGNPWLSNVVALHGVSVEKSVAIAHNKCLPVDAAQALGASIKLVPASALKVEDNGTDIAGGKCP